MFPNSSSTSLHIDLIGGASTDGIVFPRGVTIYGRWTSVTAADDSDGGIICYFGPAKNYSVTS